MHRARPDAPFVSLTKLNTQKVRTSGHTHSSNSSYYSEMSEPDFYRIANKFFPRKRSLATADPSHTDSTDHTLGHKYRQRLLLVVLQPMTIINPKGHFKAVSQQETVTKIILQI